MMNNNKKISILYACIDAMDRACSTRVPNDQGIQIACRLCGGGFAGALGWYHKPTCYVGRATNNAVEFIKEINAEQTSTNN